ncbi:MAG: hypothetical protein OEW15_18550, partial [Nitrospirota bacterium]|nr:hypothetical protein [Nitrospirota bacterium]
MPAVWTDVNIAFLSVVTSAKLNQIQANLPALAEGAAGAPRIVDAAISATADIAKSKISVTGVWAKSEQHAQTAYLDVAQSFTADYQQIEANITAAANRGLRIKDTGAAAGDKILVFGHTAQAPFIAKLNDDGTYDAGIVGWDSTGKQTAGT